MPLTIECPLHFGRAGKGARKVPVAAPSNAPPVEPGRVPRVARLMALAIHIDGLIASGAVANLAEVARLGHVSRARATQIANLALLAVDLQEQLLFLPLLLKGRDRITLRNLQPIALTLDWKKQRRMWSELVLKNS